MEEQELPTINNYKNQPANVTLNEFNKICRLCFSETEIKSFFTLHFEGLQLFEIYRELTLLQIETGDGLPEHICLTCIEKIVSMYMFIQKCQQSDKTLRNIVKSNLSNISKPIKEEVNSNPEEQIELDKLGYIKVDSKYLEVNNQHGINCTITDKEFGNSTNCPSNTSLKKEISEQREENKDIHIETELKFAKIHRVVKEAPQLFGPPFLCSMCSNLYDSYHDFKGHYRRSPKCRPRIYSCNLCPKVFTTGYKLRLHMRTHTEERPFVCEVCGDKFRYAQNLVRHKKMHTGEKPFACEICGQRFTRSTSKTEHLRLHTGELPFMCTYCGQTFIRVSDLKFHTSKHRLENGEQKEHVKALKKIQCTKCPKTYISKWKLFSHEQSHLTNNQQSEPNKQRAHLCSTCGKTYSTKSSLAIHRAQHLNKAIFCSLCNKSFYYRSSLSQHMRTHTGVRPFSCVHCNKCFAQRGHLQSHLKTHTGEKPHVCNFCGKSFALNGNLIVHKRRHTGETPYMCPVCHKGFYDSSSMKKHERTHSKYDINTKCDF